MDNVMAGLGWGGTLKAEQTAAAMARNRTIAERLGSLDQEGMGQAPPLSATYGAIPSN